MKELWLNSAPAAPNGGHFLNLNRIRADHTLHSDWREHCSVSLSPINTKLTAR